MHPPQMSQQHYIAGDFKAQGELRFASKLVGALRGAAVTEDAHLNKNNGHA